MNIKLLFDSEAADNKFKTGWGFSCLINNYTVFDTGSDGNALLNNLQQLKINPLAIKNIIISHIHYDHSKGLWTILEHRKNIKVYVCPKGPITFKDKIKTYGSNPIEIHPYAKIADNIFTTGELPGNYRGTFIPEQALILKTSQGLAIITGCAHPGIINIINIIKNHFTNDKIYLVLGGFHLGTKTEAEITNIVKNFQTLGVEKVAPLHCSGNKAHTIFEKYYGPKFIGLNVGETLNI